MTHNPISVIFCALFLTLSGCKVKHSSSSSISVGPFSVDTGTGRATGEVFGIDFEAVGATGSKITFDLSGSPESSSQAYITLAPDLRIELKTINEGEAVAFRLNNKDFGKLKEGDEVSIGEDQKVTVNGITRTPQDG